MFKERAIDFDWGTRVPSNMYNSTTGLCYESSLAQVGFDNMLSMIDVRSEACANATRSYSGSTYSGLNSERFYSTERPRPHFNNCDHHIKKGVNHPITVAYHGYTSGISKVYYFYPYYRFSPDCALDDIDSVERHQDIDLRNAQATAWGTMQPRFEGDISMFNFLMELRDFRSLLRLLRNKPLKKLRNFFVRKRRTIDPTKPIAQTYLMNEFALKPLLSDIYKITIQMEDIISEKQQEFADAGRERSSRHYDEIFTHTNSECRSATTANYDLGTRCGETLSTNFTATMEYSYRYNMRGALSAFTKYWGLQPSPEAIWNAIPFSFIVDYFLGVGDAIRVTSRDENVGLTLHQYCESLTTVRSAGFYIRPETMYCGMIGRSSITLNDLPSSDILVAGVTSSLYSRRRTYPNKGLIIPRIKMASSKQALNLGALLRCFF